MPKPSSVQSVEPNVADLVNGWLKSYNLDYKLEQESLNTQIDKALDEYHSKSGGSGGNRPDAKLLLRDANLSDWPVLIEYKGYKDRLAKFGPDGQLANRTEKNKPAFSVINSYAVNGAVHYANALLHYTDYTDVIAIGVTGWRDASGSLCHEIGVWLVSKTNLGAGQKVDDYTDLSFLRPENFDAFVAKVKALSLPPNELERLREQRDHEIDASLDNLNKDIYKNEEGLGEKARIYLVAASIFATLGIPGKVQTLEKSELKSSSENGNRDGDIILRKIAAFLEEKHLPADKKNTIVRTFENILTEDSINRAVNGESQLKRVFTKIVDDLGIYYKIGLTTDFTGKLFNKMYSWLGFTQDRLNDVVLTPPYVATLLVRLARVNKDSFVWDFATGSAGLLVAAMNEMLADAKSKIKSPDEFVRKSAKIKAQQILGLEIIDEIHMLAILNMILMGDGSSNILNRDSLEDFAGNYEFGEKDKKFPATAFVLNPPYSKAGNGMIFVEKGLSMMESGYAAIIIQNSAGSGKAAEFNRRILAHSTLLASIKMPPDLFIGKSSVQTQIYVFRVGEAHQRDDTVKFIDFTHDGYKRTNRKKAAVNLRDLGDAKARYAELIDLVRFGKSKLSIFTENEYYEGHIDPEDGSDWNQTAPVDPRPISTDFTKTVADVFAWEVLTSLTKTDGERAPQSRKMTTPLDQKLNAVKWGEFKLGDLFHIETTLSFNNDDLVDGDEYDYVTRTSTNQGVMRTTGFVNEKAINPPGTWSLGLMNMDFFFRTKPWYAGQFVRKIIPIIDIPENAAAFFSTILNRQKKSLLSVRVKNVDWTFRNLSVALPVTNSGEINFDFMETFIRELKEVPLRKLATYLKSIGI